MGHPLGICRRLPYDLTFDSSGALIVGTGRNGKLYSLTGEPTTATLLMQAGPSK